MRLINATTLRLEQFFSDVPEYAILSHTWGDDEVTLQDWERLEDAQTKTGYAKIEGSCRQALRDGINYVWVDTNCIDKTSSSELSEAINSMFSWYRDSKICYAYLADVSQETPDKSNISQAVRGSRWFTRGWTLQELIAPTALTFYSREWVQLGTKMAWRPLISELTGIDSDYLRNPRKIQQASVARRMSWMSRRVTTRVEDMAYCMLGIFDINMALLYGEGTKAFLRLQEEIIRVSNDQTIFCWQSAPRLGPKGQIPHDWLSILAPHPAVFHESGHFFSQPSNPGVTGMPYSITNFGLSITLPLLYTTSGALAVLDARVRSGQRSQANTAIVQLHRVPGQSSSHYVRLVGNVLVTKMPSELLERREAIFVDCRNARVRGVDGLISTRMSQALHVDLERCNENVVLLACNRALNFDQRAAHAEDADFHFMNSAVEASHNVQAECGVVLEGSDGPSTHFQLVVAGVRMGETIRWLIDYQTYKTQREHSRVLSMRPSAEHQLGNRLHNVTDQGHGVWRATASLMMVASWLYSEGGAVVCVLELSARTGQDQVPVRASSMPLQYLQPREW